MISRRKLIVSGFAGATGLGAAAALARRYNLIPPDRNNLFVAGETLTYATQRLLTLHQPLAREFDRSRISNVFPVNGDPPETEIYERHVAENFQNWRLTVDGLVAHPFTFALDDLKGLPSHSQITMHICEEGWSYIAEWTGVRLSYLLNLVGAQPQAKYVVFHPFDKNWDSLDMADALHPQTLLAYAMNGDPLPTQHGAPLRLRVTRQIGYKSVKYLSRITVTDTLKNIGNGLGSVSPDLGYSWYAGI